MLQSIHLQQPEKKPYKTAKITTPVTVRTATKQNSIIVTQNVEKRNMFATPNLFAKNPGTSLPTKDDPFRMDSYVFKG